MQATELLAALQPQELGSALEAAPWVLEPGVLAPLLGQLGASFPEHEPAYILLQHVRVGGSAMLREHHAAALAAAAAGTAGEGVGSSSTRQAGQAAPVAGDGSGNGNTANGLPGKQPAHATAEGSSTGPISER